METFSVETYKKQNEKREIKSKIDNENNIHKQLRMKWKIFICRIYDIMVINNPRESEYSRTSPRIH